jgi:hypothetical protein
MREDKSTVLAMKMAIFRIFSKTIDSLPAQAILKALEAECQMLLDDFARYGRELTDDGLSILSFAEYVHMIQAGAIMRCSTYLPPDHVDFYKETIVRLVQAGELPAMAVDEFDFAFSLIH